MKRKNMGNQAVIKAITIGLSAVMATAQPISVFAEEVGEVPTSTPATEVENTANTTLESHVADDAQAAAAEVETAVEAAVADNGSVDLLTTDINNNVVAGDAGTSVAEDGKTVDNAQAVIEAGDAVEADKATLAADDKVIEHIEQDLDVAEKIDAKETVLSEEVVKDVNDAVATADEVTSYMKDATQTAGELRDEIVNATSIGAAQTAYDNLEALATEAAAKVEEASNTLATLEAKYDAAKAELLAAANAYNAVVAHSSSEATKVKENLEAAEANVAALQAAVEKAQTGVEETNKGALDIIAAQNAVKDAKSVDWTKEDTLFYALMQNYYIPQVISEDATDIKVEKFTKQSADDSYNYCKVTYKVGDETKTEYYNYKMEDGSNSTIKIFSKSEDEVGAANHIAKYCEEKKINTNENKKKVTESGVYSYTGKDGEKKYITGVEVDALGDKVVEVDGVKYIKGTAGAKDVKLSEVAAPNKTDLNVNETADAIHIGTSSYHYEIIDGVLSYVETADVTTSKYQRLNSKPTTTYKKCYTEAEKNALIAALGEGVSFAEAVDDVVVEKDANGKEIKYYVLTGTSYVPTFTATGINVNRRCDCKNGESNAKNEVINQIKGQNYTIISNNLKAKHDGSIVKFGDEDYRVTGSVTVVINGCTVKLDAKDFKTGEYTSEAAAKIALEKLVKSYLNNDNKSATVYVSTEYTGGHFKAGKTKDTYGYSTSEGYKDLDYKTESYNKYACYIDYLKLLSSEIEEGKTISVEQYQDAMAISTAIIQNQQLLANNYLGEESKDEGLKAFLENAQGLVDKYNRLSEEAATAKEELGAAKEKANALVDAIDEMKSQDNKVITAVEALGVEDLATYFGIELDSEDEADKLNNMTLDEAIKYLDEKLADAKKAVKDAEIALEDLQDQLKDAGDDLDDTIRRLTPPPASEEEGGDETTTPVVVLPTATGNTTINLNALMANAPQGRVAGVNRTGTTTIADNKVPLAATVENTNATDKEEKAVEIADKNVPLASNIVNEETSRSWWWLLLVAIAGAVGFGSYKYYDNQKKKETVSAKSDK